MSGAEKIDVFEHCVLLRGINVGGVRMKMGDLRDVLEGAGFGRVRTVLASGNVVLESSEADAERVKAQVEAALRDGFDYEAWVVVISGAELRAVVEGYPFDGDAEGIQPYVMFASDPASLDALGALECELDSEVERVERGPSVLYWEVVRGKTTKSRFGKEASKARYKATTTTRNMRTLRKILALTR
ncbi:DUF1697 domain-containing protein [Lujinxingia vulgaris]|uniref:DUF1697 domain-containing protein n=1 Tax=Lujinxingia vulgaris TaxID=2600176 RepID=A0A5C6XIR8_9DELT|nr:DUF1697 domain-containing protein [Lujinxingia vulgaris]TXD37479.1 DUF1697 domain-containing protein [Lujinxingia vulgaris]